jgi:glyoxylase-like metal-dependent hydrolase (beta-lactamase superfamily II)
MRGMRLAALALITLLTVAPVAQAPADASLDSYRRARAALDAAIAAHGGADAFRKLGDATVTFTGQSFARNQSRLPAPPYDAAPRNGRVVADFAKNRMLFEQTNLLPGGFDFSNRTVITGNEGFAYRTTMKTLQPLTNVPVLRTVQLERALPHLLLQRASVRASTLRWLGVETVGGVEVQTITFASETGAQTALSFDAGTRLLTRLSTVTPDFLEGDATQEVIWAAYRIVGGVQWPGTRVVRQAGEITESIAYGDVVVGSAPPDEWFARPGDGVELKTPPARPVEAQPLGDGAWLLTGLGGGGYNVLFVEFPDHLVVVEAPLGSETSRRAIEAIQKTVPGKPIRYLALTHHHSDHAGGIREYVAEGATIVTTPGNRAFFERAAAARHTVEPDLQERARKPLRIETFTGSRAFEGGRQRLVLYDIGPSPHAQEMVIAVLPALQAVFQGDLLNAASPYGLDVQANATSRHFLERLQAIAPDTTVVLGVHMAKGTMELLKEAVAAAP